MIGSFAQESAEGGVWGAGTRRSQFDQALRTTVVGPRRSPASPQTVMKPIHKRIYTVLPRPVASASCPPTSSNISRVRSNSVSSSRALYTASPSSSPLSFFDAPPQPPPSSRSGNSNYVVSTRLAAEVKAEFEGHTDSPYSQNLGQNASQSQTHSGGPPSYSLALSSGQSESVSHTNPHFKSFFPYSSFSPAFCYGPSSSSDDVKSELGARRELVRYHLDVGAYGIPKRSRGSFIAGRDGHGRLGSEDGLYIRHDRTTSLNRAVQVGEDAYFVHGNAMGVADGVGGWSRVHRADWRERASPSALFARRLMHYCSEEVEAASADFSSVDARRPSASASATHSRSTDIFADLQDSLEELEEGLDVLMILEKAYEKTMESHVLTDLVPTDGICSEGTTMNDEHGQAEQSPTIRSHGGSQTRRVHVASDGKDKDTFSQSNGLPAVTPSLPQSTALSSPPSTPRRLPLCQGSSTALLAVLEHPVAKSSVERRTHLFGPIPQYITQTSPASDRGAIIKIAHLGDCMGMLIRGEEIVWRTEEMWWNFNTPVQLGPASPTRPRDAQVFTVPVQADDILILASDGLSDNLWDEDVLDEVIRFRRPFIADGSWCGPPPTSNNVKGVFGRSTLAAMLSEALCSRARRAAERRSRNMQDTSSELEVPFARRAREQGKSFRGGKPDDISVLVAVVSPESA